MSQVTVLILVPNAGDRLARCLDTVTWADDVFCVIDTKTTDGSDAVARAYTEHVVVHEYENPTAQLHWALDQIETEWTFVVDADEWLSQELIERVKTIIKNPDSHDAYRIRRWSYFFGAMIRHCGWHRDYNPRLFRTLKGHYIDKRVHTKFVVDGPVGTIDEPMFHDDKRNFEEYFWTFQRFTSWGAEDLYDKGRRARLTDLLFRPPLKFIKMFVLRQGFRDGMRGAVLCGLGAFSVFTKYAKLWNLERLREKGESEAP